MSLRVAEPHDSEGIVQLVTKVLDEYGETICLEPGGAEADLQDLRSYFEPGGCFWVLEDTVFQKIVGTHAMLPVDEFTCTFKRLYLHRDLRGTDCGHRLMQRAIDFAKENSFERIEFWSDTRFERAHRFFEKCGFERSNQVRTMSDSFEPYQEYHFFKVIDPAI